MDKEGLIHVIVAEDHPVIREFTTYYVKQLDPQKVVVHECTDGEEAYNKYRELKAARINPDVLITDGSMPRMDGFELLKSNLIRSDHDMLKIMYSTHELRYISDTDLEAFSFNGQPEVSYVHKPQVQDVAEIVKARVQALESGLVR